VPLNTRLISARSFLVRGLLAGLVAGIIAFGVAFVVGESSVNASIAIEESGSADPGHDRAQPAMSRSQDTVVPRSLQSTLGLLTGTTVAGVTLGGLIGVLSAAALGRLGRLGIRGTVLVVTTLGFVSCYLLPSLAYPPNPPSIGQPDTIGYRTALYFSFVAISVIAALAALLAGRSLAVRWGSWYASIAAGAGYLVLTLVALRLMPTYNEVPADFPAAVLYDFRRASLITQLALWAVLGLTLAELVHRLAKRAQLSSPTSRLLDASA
jgi:predicted cobalt transporter CbtA